MRGLMPARTTLGTALLVVLAGCKSTARTGELRSGQPNVCCRRRLRRH